MSEEALFPGMPFDENVRLKLAEAFPDGTVSVTRGRHYALEENSLYLVRIGPDAVILPRMAYGEEVAAALKECCGGEDQVGGREKVSQTCGDHS